MKLIMTAIALVISASTYANSWITINDPRIDGLNILASSNHDSVCHVILPRPFMGLSSKVRISEEVFDKPEEVIKVKYNFLTYETSMVGKKTDRAKVIKSITCAN
jgi:hypothetical protein